jgi:hypothetical protein
VTIGESIRTGFRRATRWRLLLLCMLLSAVPAALATLPLWRFLSGLLDHAPRAALLATGLEGSWIPDLARALGEDPQGQAIPGGMLSALVVALLLGPALAGAMLAEAGSAAPLRFRALLTGAGRYYARMFRTVLVAVIPLGVAGLGAVLVSKSTEKAVARMVTEAAAASRGRWALVAMGALFFVAHLTLDAGRARMAAQPDRRSALKAWFSGTWLVLRRPVHAFSIGLAGALAGPVLGLVVMAFRERLPAGPRWAVFAGVLLAQAAAVAVGWGRAVRLAGLTRLARDDQEARLSRRRPTPSPAPPPAPPPADPPP